MTTTVDFLQDFISEEYKSNEIFTLQDLISRISDPWDDVFDGRTSEDSREACVRENLQKLRDRDVITFIDNKGTYRLNSIEEEYDFDSIDDVFDTKQSWGEEDIEFELQRMKNQHNAGEMPLPKGKEIEVVGDPLILRKDQIIDHDEALKLGLTDYLQARDGNDADMNRVESIKESRKSDGYLLGVAPLPAVSKLKPRDGAKVTEPIVGSDGKIKTHVLRNGRHRFLSEDEYLRCWEVDSEHEDFLELFGTTANNPFAAVEAVGVTTEKDAIAATRMWIRKKRLEIIEGEDDKNLKVVCKFLKDNYPHINNRVVVAREILALEGVKCSIKTFYDTDVKNFASSVGGFTWGHDYDKKIARFSFVLNSSTTIDRATEEVERFKTDNEGWKVEVYASLNNTPNGRNVEVTPENINQIRRDEIAKFDESEDYCVKFANQKKRGKIEPTKYIFVPQDNKNEDQNCFY